MVYDILFSRRSREDEQREIEFRDSDTAISRPLLTVEKKNTRIFDSFYACMFMYVRNDMTKILA